MKIHSIDNIFKVENLPAGTEYFIKFQIKQNCPQIVAVKS